MNSIIIWFVGFSYLYSGELNIQDLNMIEDEPEKKIKSSKPKTKAKSKLSAKAKSSDSTPKNAKKRQEQSTDENEELHFEPDKILGACPEDDYIMFRVKVKDSNRWEIVKNKVLHKSCPDLVIQFYEKHLILEGEFLDFDESFWEHFLNLIIFHNSISLP